MTDDTITPLQDRITKIVGDEERLNRKRLTMRKEQTDRRDAEKRAENSNLATLEKERGHQLGVNAEKERKFQEDLRRDGEELIGLSKVIRDDYIAETQRREAAKKKLEEKVTALEAKLRSIGYSRS